MTCQRTCGYGDDVGVPTTPPCGIAPESCRHYLPEQPVDGVAPTCDVPGCDQAATGTVGLFGVLSFLCPQHRADRDES